MADRYKAYQGLGWHRKQMELAKQLLFKGKFNYYEELKQLSPKDPKTFYNDIKKELKQANNWHTSAVYRQLIEEEVDLDAILEWVKEEPSRIEQHAKQLFTQFPEEVIQIYNQFIKIEAKVATNRKAYRRVCYKIKDAQPFIGP